jgi:periplasmic mercuric ion binding protein
VKDFSFDDKAMTITITYKTKQTTPEKLRLAIAAIGFDADEVKAEPKAVEKLDDCCRKVN